MPRLFVRCASIAFALIVCASFTLAAEVEVVDEGTGIDAVLSSIPVGDDKELVWSQGEALAKMGEPAKEALLALVTEAKPAQRLAICYALLKMGEQRPAVQALVDLIADKDAPLSRRLDAVGLMGTFGGSFAKYTLNLTISNKDLPEVVRLEAARNLWKQNNGAAAHEALVALMNESKSSRIQTEAALILARNGRYALVADRLKKIAELPGPYGDQANTLIGFNEKLDEKTQTDAFTNQLIGEIVYKIRQSYAYDTTDEDEAEQLKSKNLATSAARAMVQYLDDFNDYLDEEAYQDMIDQMRSDYGGIGAYVGMRDGLFTILTPMYGKPAFQAKLRAGDFITHIDDVDITEMPLNKIIKRLKGKPGTIVTVRVIRKGWVEPRDIKVRRDLITMPMTYSQMLPGKVGYVRLNGFQEDPYRHMSTSIELKQALRDFKKEGVKGVVLDLRGNPGGLLTEAVAVCENFLERDKLVVFSRGKIRPRQDYRSGIIGRPVYEGPLVVLIDGGSASASEIVAGALRDHKRATIVGDKSYGKGSVQMLLPINTTAGATRLKLTIAKYYLPDGECIHGRDKGIKPHVEVKEPTMTATEGETRWNIHDSRIVQEWVESKWEEHGVAFKALLDFDGGKLENYPGHEEIFKIVTEKFPENKITPEMMRKELRLDIFSHMRDMLGDESHPVDVQASAVLQRGLIALYDEMDEPLPDLPLYNSFRDKFKEDEKKEALAVNDESETKTDDEAATPEKAGEL